MFKLLNVCDDLVSMAHGTIQKERFLADQVSSYVNKAYKTLQSPLSRAKYLLELYGIPISESDGLDARNDMDQEVLFYVMETREQIEEVNTTRELEELEKLNIEKIQSTLSAINHSIQYLPPPPSTPASSPDWLDSNRKYLNQFKSEVIRLQYLETLNEAIGDKKFRVSIDG
ncbi:hypothetical protein BKA69DRAFT_1065789 [Paraphysoderma sedebokerense]|nr:hypothetical protein BKA69DRAFT_1065789 [Paraphysoderma sedebokerense]